MLDEEVAILVDGTSVPWGDTLAQAAARLAPTGEIRSDFFSARLVAPCQSAFGISTFEVELVAPALHKPVLTFDFNFPAARSLSDFSSANEWPRHFEKRFGRRTSVSELPNFSNSNIGMTQFAWDRWPLHILLSIYHQDRLKDRVRVAANLSLSWVDEISIGRPFAVAAENRSNLLSAAVLQADLLRRFETLESQRQVYQESFLQSRIPGAEVRKAQRALHCDHLADTPVFLSERMTDRSVLLWSFRPVEENLILSTKWDSVDVIKAMSSRFDLVIYYPARGIGGVGLQIGHMIILDKFGTVALEELARVIEEKVHRTFRRFELADS